REVAPAELGLAGWRRTARLAGVILPSVAVREATVLTPVPPAAALAALVRQSPWLLACRAAAPAVLALLGRAVERGAFSLRLARGSGGGMLSRVVWRLALDERAGRLRQTLVGRYWALVLPLLESGAFTLVFTLFIRPRVMPAAYLLFVYVGVLAWRAFARAVTAAGASLVRAAPLLRQVPVPATAVATAAIVGACLDALIAVPLLVVAVVALHGIPP